MKSFKHLAPALRVFQGADSLQHLSRELDRLQCRRAVVFCGATLGRAGSPLHAVHEALGDRCVGTYSGVRAHSPLPAVEEAAAELMRLQADAVIAVGGGSAMVTARAASILLAEQAPARALCTHTGADGKLVSPRLSAPKIAQLVIPTTPSTAMIKVGSAMLEPETGARLALFDPKTRAQGVFIHPAMLASASAELISGPGLNTLTLAIEGLLSHGGDPISDALLMHAVRLLVAHLGAPAGDDDIPRRTDLMLAAIMSGLGTDHTGAGMAIPLGHAVSARFHVDNGLANAILLPHVLRFNAPVCSVGIGKLASALGLPQRPAREQLEDVLAALQALFGAMGIPGTLRQIGVTLDAIPELAAVTMGDWFLRANPRPVEAASVLESLLSEAW